MQFSHWRYYFLLFILLVGTTGFFVVPSRADDTQASIDSATATKDELQQQLDAIDKEIAAAQSQLNSTTKQKNALTAKIKTLQLNEKKLQLLIKDTTSKINRLEQQITATKKSITITVNKENKLRGQLSAVLGLINQHDKEMLIESLANKNGLADSFVAIQNYNKIFTAVASLTSAAKQTHDVLVVQQQAYDSAETDAQNFLQIKALQQVSLKNTITDQNVALTETKNQEAVVQKTLTEKKQQAAQIQNRLYQLVGASQQINFGQALTIANWVSSQVAIRPAFLLAILTQESNLGGNVGTCNRINDPPSKSWKVIMKPDRDQGPFQQITQALGKDTDTTPVSCPMYNRNGTQNGWGGAMGPAQFIPSTWLGYANRVTGITGHSPANPWDNRDAFLASALKLSADGASAKDLTDEWNAAMRYFSGGLNTRYRFYGDNVIATEKKYQIDIDNLANDQAP